MIDMDGVRVQAIGACHRGKSGYLGFRESVTNITNTSRYNELRYSWTQAHRGQEMKFRVQLLGAKVLRAIFLCGGAVFSPAALAADLPAAPFAAPAPIFTWTGLYIGANMGAALSPGNPSFQSLGFGSNAFDLPPSGGGQAGFTGGLQGGYNYQIGAAVLGVETDFNYLENCRNGTFGAPGAYARFGVNSYSLSGGCALSYGTLRARLGYAFDRVLFYATGGIAYGGDRGNGSIVLGPAASGTYFAASTPRSALGKYVFGGGIEYALTDHWFARAEYLHVNLGRDDQLFNNGAGQLYTSSQINQNNIFRLGLDYKFNSGDATAETPPASPGAAPPASTEAYSAHGQITWLPQGYPGFPAAYSGPQSLPPQAHVAQNLEIDAYLGLRLWQGAAIYLNPEIDQGFGVGNTFGIAGYPNAFAFKVGSSEPYVRNQRYFLRQIVGLGGETERIDSGPSQLAGPVDSNRLTFTVGKYSVVDIFDDNKYAHDPINTFLNWTIIDMGAFDYAADFLGLYLWRDGRMEAGLVDRAGRCLPIVTDTE